MSPDDMDAVFQALAHKDRRTILDIVKSRPGCTVGSICGHFSCSRIAVLKHLRVLEAAGLLISEKTGRTRQMFHNAVPIQMIYDRWTTEYSALWASHVTRIKYSVEGAARPRARRRKPKKDGNHG